MKHYTITSKDGWVIIAGADGDKRVCFTSQTYKEGMAPTIEVIDYGNGIKLVDHVLRKVKKLNYSQVSGLLAALLIMSNEGNNFTNFQLFEGIPVATIAPKKR